MKKKKFHLWFSKLRCFPAAVKPSSTPHTPNKKPLSLENSDHYSSTSTSADDYFFSDDSTSESDAAVVPDFSAAFASRRFFFSSPGYSNSIFNSSPDHAAAVDGGVKVRKVLADPVVYFRASMQEMIGARDRPVDVRRDWQYLQELLVCYLQINPVDIHKFILNAFSDLVVYLLESRRSSPPTTVYGGSILTLTGGWFSNNIICDPKKQQNSHTHSAKSKNCSRS